METPVKQRLIGALVLALVAILFLPLILTQDVKAPDVTEVPLDMPKAPESEFETRDLPLNVPSGKAPAGGVLGVPKPAVDPAIEIPVASSGVDNIVAPVTEELAPISTPISQPVEVAKPADSKVAETKPVTSVTKPVLEKTAEVKPSEVKPAAIAAGNFIIAIGSFSNMDSANSLVARLKAQKLPVLTEKITLNGKAAMKIRIGPFADRAAAEAARVKADQIAGSTSKVSVQDAAPIASTASKPSTTKPAATTSSGFSVQLEALSDKTKAEDMRNRARSLGFNAFVTRVETEKGVLFSVRLGPVADRDAANKLRDEATQKLGKTGIVKTYP